MESSGKTRQIWVFDNPRTCSQVMHRIFKPHPQLETKATHQWALHATIAGPERIQTRADSSQKAQAADVKLQSDLKATFPPEVFDIEKETYAVARERLTGIIENAEAEVSIEGLFDILWGRANVCPWLKGKIPYVKEHIACIIKPAILSELLYNGSIEQAPSNPTSIPDQLFEGIQQPLLQIRHPALVIPSFYKAQLVNFTNDPNEDVFKMWTMQRTTRWLLDFLREQGRDHVLVDAEDLISNPELLCRKLCDIWEIDFEGLAFEWKPTTFENGYSHPLEHFCGTLYGSKSIIHPEQKIVDIDVEQAKWAREWGQDVAAVLRERVDADMSDYTYMQQFRLHLD